MAGETASVPRAILEEEMKELGLHWFSLASKYFWLQWAIRRSNAGVSARTAPTWLVYFTGYCFTNFLSCGDSVG